MNKPESFVWGVTPMITDDVFRDRVLRNSPGSILAITPSVNEVFGGSLPDDAPINGQGGVVNVFRDSAGAIVDLTLSDLWTAVGATSEQRHLVVRGFRALLSFSRPPETIGDLRNLARTGARKKIPGVQRRFELFCEDSFRKREDSSS